jgi:hypothetical protein
VVVRKQRAVAANEIEQVRHLLEIGWHVRVVPEEMHVVKDDEDDVLDITVCRVELARSRAIMSFFCQSRGARDS